jgi:hypothetical protein
MRIFPRQDPTVNNRPCKHHKQGFEFGKSGRLRLCPSTQVPVVSAVSFLDQGWLRPPFSAFLYPRRAVPVVDRYRTSRPESWKQPRPSRLTRQFRRQGAKATARTGERLNASGRPGTTTAGRPSGLASKNKRRKRQGHEARSSRAHRILAPNPTATHHTRATVLRQQAASWYSVRVRTLGEIKTRWNFFRGQRALYVRNSGRACGTVCSAGRWNNARGRRGARTHSHLGCTARLLILLLLAEIKTRNCPKVKTPAGSIDDAHLRFACLD